MSQASAPLDRRAFHQLTLAALSGLSAGVLGGCGQAPSDQRATPAGAAAAELTEAEQILLAEPHVCRGLNTCKGLGRSKENECAGTGTCASIADHACAGQNECKGQGGCGSNPGMNSCKGQGGCHIPLMEDAWTRARGVLEGALQKQGKTAGAAPVKA